MAELKAFFKENKKRALEVFVGLLIVFQFSGFVSVFSEHVDPRSLLSSRDADASHVVGTANKTRWYKDNGETAYGAFFYRTIHTFGTLVGREFANSDSDMENRERAHHLAVMVLSLLSVFLVGFVLARLMIRELWAQGLFTIALSALFLSNPVWATFVFRAHPDMMFGLAVLGAFLATHRAVNEGPSSIWFKLAALLWGAAGMIKLTFVLFLPVMWLLWMPPFSRDRLKIAWRFYLWMLPSYLLLGFPQSFNIPRSLKFLAYQSQFSIAPTADSFFNWLSQLKTQGLWPLVAVMLIALFADAKTRFSPRLLILFGFPLLMLLRQNSEYQMDYYLIPLIAVGLAVAALLLKGRVGRASRYQSGFITVFAGAVFFTIGFVPKTMEAEMRKPMTCRAESLAVYRSIHSYVDQGRIFALDPYTPYDRNRAGEKVNASWENSWDRVAKNGANALAINREYGQRFTAGDTPSPAVQSYAPAWPQVRAFYQSILAEGDKATDPSGATWTRVERHCGWEIWLKE